MEAKAIGNKVTSSWPARWNTVKSSSRARWNKVKSSSLARWIRKWKWFVFSYLMFLVIALYAIELRVGPVWRDGRIADRMPLFVAIYAWVGHPERLQYVATTDLPLNHQLTRSDFTFPPITESLYRYLPRIDDLKGKYLKKDVKPREPIFLTYLNADPTIEPQADAYTVNIRLSKQTIPKGFLEPKSIVVMAPKDSTAKLEGLVLSSTREEAPSPSPAKTIEGKKPLPAASPNLTSLPTENGTPTNK